MVTNSARRCLGGETMRCQRIIPCADDQRGDCQLIQWDPVSSQIGDEAIEDRTLAAGFKREQQLTKTRHHLRFSGGRPKPLGSPHHPGERHGHQLLEDPEEPSAP